MKVKSRQATRSPDIPASGKGLSQPICLLIILCAIATTLLSTGAARIEKRYLEHYPYFYDAASYYTETIELAQLCKREGIPAALLHEVKQNPRYPLRTIPLVIFAPHLLETQLGHMWTSVPLLFIFLSLLATTIFRRSHSFTFATLAIGIASAVPILLEPKLGLGAFWLDLAAAMSFGSAVLCLINYCLDSRPSWLLALGVMFSATALCRFSAAFYLILFLMLAVPIASWGRFRSWRAAVRPVIFGLLGALPGIWFVATYFAQNQKTYSAIGYAFGADVSQAMRYTALASQQICGTPLLVLLLGLTLFSLIQLRKKEDHRPLLISLWAPLSIFVFLAIIVRAVDGPHAVTYMAPALLVSGLVPSLVGSQGSPGRLKAALAGLLLPVTGAMVISNYLNFSIQAQHPGPVEDMQKQVDRQLSQQIIKYKANTFQRFDTESIFPSLEVIFQSGRYLHVPECLFSVHESYFKFWFPKMTAKQMADAVWHRTQYVDLVAVFHNPQDARVATTFNNEISATVSAEIAARLKGHGAWQLVGQVKSPLGLLDLYRNKQGLTWADLVDGHNGR